MAEQEWRPPRRADGTVIRPVEERPTADRERAERRPGGASWAPLQATDHMPALTDPFSPATEQFRMLRVRVDARRESGDGALVLAVTSSFPAEGKTSVALNLAVVAAQEPERRVVLVECDLRRPRIGHLLARPPVLGLSDVLAGKATLESVITDLSTPPGLSMVIAGRPPQNPVELLGSEAMRRTLENLRRRFDTVIVDSPPALHFADASQLTAYLDAFLLVARSGRTPREALARTWRLLGSERVLGVVLNDVDPGPGSGYGYGYHSYGYGTPPPADEAK